MYLNRVHLSNIRSLSELIWECPVGEEAGWHVIIGDNGSGKSTFLRSIALCLVGPSEAMALRQNWNDWLRFGENQGAIDLTFTHDKELDKFTGKGQGRARGPLYANIGLVPGEEIGGRKSVVLRPDRDSEAHLWGSGKGWFSASYGPFRRFSGGDKDYEKIFYSNPRLAPHLSIFGENVALTECLDWLRELRFKQLERPSESNLLNEIRAFVNQEGFLPHHAQLEQITSEGVTFVDGNGCSVRVEEMSDGYRSILSMTFELIRQLSLAYGPESVFDKDDPTRVAPPGVVLIDEIDAHLHPTWQRKVGKWFRDHFPNIQFIVSTHSPLICQAADVGTVFRLPRPGTEEKGRMIVGTELDRLLYGDVLDAYGTELFGRDISRSEESKKRLQRLAELNQKELHGSLTEDERSQQQELRGALPTSAHILNGTAGDDER